MLNKNEELDLIKTIAPTIANRIHAKNDEFEATAQSELDGTWTVAERNRYLADSLRVPHLRPLQRLNALGPQLWKELDPSTLSDHWGFSSKVPLR